MWEGVCARALRVISAEIRVRPLRHPRGPNSCKWEVGSRLLKSIAYEKSLEGPFLRSPWPFWATPSTLGPPRASFLRMSWTMWIYFEVF